jgi:hypothetical protein
MALDPYRTLGLSAGAAPAEVKAAYRRLAKINHPDTAGEAAIPRFLAIQRAYEAILGRRPMDRGRRPARGARGGGSWQQAGRSSAAGSSDRAERAREPSGSPPSGEGDSAGTSRRRPGAAGRGRPGGRTRDGRADPRPGSAGRRTGDGATPRGRAARKATLGSTSYDGVDREPFDPEWSGASWYGTASGTYWTLNPKEYADPRKHGPEYLARARRGAPRTTLNRARDGEEASGSSPTDDPARDGRGAPAAEAAWPDPTATDAGQAAWSPAPGRGGDGAPARGRRPSSQATGQPDQGQAARVLRSAILGRLLDPANRPADRFLVALLAWPPVGLAVATVAGEVSGCGRFAATCSEASSSSVTVAVLAGQVAILAVLVALPRLATLFVAGTLAVLVAALPAAAMLSLAGGSRPSGVAGRLLVEIMTVAWLAGVVLAVRRRRARSATESPDRTMAS